MTWARRRWNCFASCRPCQSRPSNPIAAAWPAPAATTVTATASPRRSGGAWSTESPNPRRIRAECRRLRQRDLQVEHHRVNRGALRAPGRNPGRLLQRRHSSRFRAIPRWRDTQGDPRRCGASAAGGCWSGKGCDGRFKIRAGRLQASCYSRRNGATRPCIFRTSCARWRPRPRTRPRRWPHRPPPPRGAFSGFLTPA